MDGLQSEMQELSSHLSQTDSNLVAAYASIVDRIDLAQQSNRETEGADLAVSESQMNEE